MPKVRPSDGSPEPAAQATVEPAAQAPTEDNNHGEGALPSTGQLNGRAVFRMPSVFMTPPDQDPSEVKAPDKIIPLEKLHEALFDLKYADMDSNEFKRIIFNVLFYASWFPEETRREFDLAQALYASNNLKPSVGLMSLEEMAAPDAKRFMKWIRKEAEGLSKTGSIGGNAVDVVQTLELGKIWMKHLSESDQNEMRVLFKPVYDHVASPKFNWNIGIMMQSSVISGAGELAGIETEYATAAVVDEVLSVPPSKETIERLQNVLFHSVFEKKSIDPEVAKKIYDYLSKNAEGLHPFSNYWNAWEYLLTMSPTQIPDFIAKHEYWRGLLVDDNESWNYYDNKDGSTFVSLYSIYERLITSELVPDSLARETVLIILKQEAEYKYLNYDDYAKIDTLKKLRERIAADFLHKEAGLLKSDRDSDELYFMGEVFLKSFAKKWGAEKTIAFIKKSLPKDVVANLDTSFDIIRFSFSKSPRIAKKVLAKLTEIGKKGRLKEPSDPLWEKMFDIFGGPEPYFDMQTRRSDISSYNNHMLGMPDYLIKAGFGAMVKDFYFSQHPFKAIYNLPDDIRPEGEGQSYVTIDEFPDLTKTAHPDEPNLKIALPSEKEWEKPERKEFHGFLTSTLAVGDSLGLAPKAGLYAIPLGQETVGSLPQKLLESLREVKRLKMEDPSIGVVGLSLGLEVPKDFKDTAKGSALYKELEKMCEELHDMGVTIVVSSGNDGQSDNANLIGFLPHIKLVGAYYTHYTSDRKDDTPSDYSTNGMVDIYAPADPVLSYYSPERIQWMVKGGTSSAQPYVSATILLMHDVNPALALDECWQILNETADPLAKHPQAKAIDPMEAIIEAAKRPGSKYEGKRLQKLEKALIGK